MMRSSDVFRLLRVTAVLMGVLGLLSGADAHAQGRRSASAEEDCGNAGTPWVQVDFGRWGVARASRARALRDLRASLKDVGIRACLASETSATSPLAILSVASQEEAVASEQQVVVTVSVNDAVTAKNTSREIDLRRFPKGARELALAIAADELLRASWAELSLSTQASKDAEVAAPTETKLAVRAVRSVQNTAEPRDFRLGARVAAASYGGGQRQFGGDGVLEWELPSCFLFSWALGFRQSQDVRAELGTVAGRTLIGEGKLGCTLLQTDMSDIGIGVGAAFGSVTFAGRAAEGSVGQEYSAWFVYARSELTANLRLGKRVGLPFGVSLGAPVQSATALAENREPVTAMSGLEVGVSLGFKVTL